MYDCGFTKENMHWIPITQLNQYKAYVMGLMHHIGRRAGIKSILHIFDGYDYMMKMG